MATDIESRKLINLRVIDLRTELAKRNLDKTGVKNELIERLQKALIADGYDPEEYIFDIDTVDKKPSRNSKRRTMGEGDLDKEDSGANDSSFVSEEDAQENKEDEVTQVEQNKENSPQESNTTTSETKTSTPPQQQQQQAQETSPSDNVEKPAEKTAEVSEDKIELNASSTTITDDAASSTPDKKAESSTTETTTVAAPAAATSTTAAAPTAAATAAAAQETPVKDENAPPKEQRNTIAKKTITEESKEKPNDTNKEDNEDSINLTIGEDEVKLFGEEEESSHEKDTKDDQQQSGNAGQEGEKESNADKNSAAKSEQEKQDQKTPVKKVTTPKGNGSSRNLWVSGLSSMTRATDLKTLFSKFGKVVGAKIVTNAKTPGSRCYGYVTMLSADDATVSMQNLNKTELDGRMISVERAKDDGTGPARPKVAKKEPEKKKVGAEAADDKKPDIKKPAAAKTAEGEAKPDDKKDEKKSTSIKDVSEDVNGESKTGSPKSDKIDHRGRPAGNRGFVHDFRNRSRENGKPRSGVLTFAQIKEERERNRLKEKERALRIEERRRHIERDRQREIERRQREEAVRLERERVKLKMEREKIEREKAELLKLEREAQRIERERLQREKEEIRRAQMKLEESRRAIKRPMEIPRNFDDDRKRRPPSPDRRHNIHVSSSSSNRKEIPPRSNGARGRSPPYASSRRDGYDNSGMDSSRKEALSHSSRDKSGKDSSRVVFHNRYDHHSSYKSTSSHASEDVRSNDLRHRYQDIASKSSSAKETNRYDRNVPSEGWSRSASGMSSAIKSFSGGLSSGGSTSISSRDPWQPSSSERKSDAPPPWARSGGGGSTSDRSVYMEEGRREGRKLTWKR
ncbi:scaffold attachment factor B2-like isoform X3 [Planococcus citri]|uniref:scaffold attachment factor B2-like isoform X3 n=1 Tax=Planococcus citri TaxID=170843 RepID=UPI0031F95312